MTRDQLAEANLLSNSKYSDDTGGQSDSLEQFTDQEDLVYHDEAAGRRCRKKSNSGRYSKLRQAVSSTHLSARRILWLGIAFALLGVIAGIAAVLVIHSMRPRTTTFPGLHEDEEGKSSSYCTTWTLNESEWPHMISNPTPINSSAYVTGITEDIRVIGIVFFGRSQYVDVLDCYLRRNLKINGGLVDEFLFMKHTSNQRDLAYVQNLVASEPAYRLLNPPENCEGNDYGCIWSLTAELDTLYIKIDDDITYIHDEAIPQLIKSRIENPEPFAISANLINSPLTGWIHYHLGAIHAFLPEIASGLSANRQLSKPTWRNSDLPIYLGDLDRDINATLMNPPFMGHRWLPIKNKGSVDVLSTPFGFVDSPGLLDFGHLWREWSLAAQQHYSLFQNLEEDAMSRYYLGSSGGFWNTQFTRYNLNFLAIWGRDVRDHLPIYSDDEHAFTVQLPIDTSRPLLIDSKAIVAHFHFYPQNEKMQMTDALDRYRAYANEKVCTKENKKKPLASARRCSAFNSR